MLPKINEILKERQCQEPDFAELIVESKNDHMIALIFPNDCWVKVLYYFNLNQDSIRLSDVAVMIRLDEDEEQKISIHRAGFYKVNDLSLVQYYDI